MPDPHESIAPVMRLTPTTLPEPSPALEPVIRRARKRRTRRLATGAVIVAFILSAIAVPVAGLVGLRHSVSPSGTDGWRRYEEPYFGWTLRYPSSWHVYQPGRFMGRCTYELIGTVISNVRLAARHGPSTRCDWPPSFPDAPAGAVAVAFGFFEGGPSTVRQPGTPDTRLPLSLEGAVRQSVPVHGGNALRLSVDPVLMEGLSRFSVHVWLGPRASASDESRARRIVDSIRTPGPSRPPAWRARSVPAMWALQSISPEGRSITIRVATGGRGGCLYFDHAEVTTTPEGVLVDAFDAQVAPGLVGNSQVPATPYACLLGFMAQREVIPLGLDIRGRTLLGECTLRQRGCADLQSP